MFDDDIPDITGDDNLREPAPRLSPLLRLWILRLLMGMNCHRKFVRSRDFADDDIAAALGLRKFISPVSGSFDRKSVMAELAARHQGAEAKRASTRPPAILARNVKRLAKMRRERDLNFEIQVDGGINTENGAAKRALGVDNLVGGSMIFLSDDINETVRRLKNGFKID